MRKGDDRPTCLHCQKQGNKEAKCWVLHLELKPKWFKDKKEKKKATFIIEDLGSDSEDETKITIVGVKGKAIVGNTSTKCGITYYVTKNSSHHRFFKWFSTKYEQF